jgi:hypothetical protein
VLKKGQTFYTRGGRIHKRFKSWRGKVQIIKVNKKLTDVNLQPGDIIGWRDIVHTNIYVGTEALVRRRFRRNSQRKSKTLLFCR